jgi:ABC-type uncharacterized transport system auxiliary subunit
MSMIPLHNPWRHRTTVPLLLILSLVWTIAIAGCASPRSTLPEVRYYTFSYAPPEYSLPLLPEVLSILPFTASPEYDTRRIVYQEREFALLEYAYHRWRSNPSQLIANHLTRDLRAGTMFKGVVSADSLAHASHLLEGNVDEILELNVQEQRFAVLGLSISLLAIDRSLPREMVLFQKSYSTRVPIRVNHPRGLAAAMSEAMAELSLQIGMDVHSALSGQEGETSYPSR